MAFIVTAYCNIAIKSMHDFVKAKRRSCRLVLTILQRSSEWAILASSSILTNCRTSDTAASSNKQCSWYNQQLAALVGHSMRVPFKLFVLEFRCLHRSACLYLIRYITPVSAITERSHLGSAATGCFIRACTDVQRAQTLTVGLRAFSISSSCARNSLPVDLRDLGLSPLTINPTEVHHVLVLFVCSFVCLI